MIDIFFNIKYQRNSSFKFSFLCILSCCFILCTIQQLKYALMSCFELAIAIKQKVI